MDFESKLEKIVKDIRDREDREMALAFTNVVCSLLRENGVAVKTSRYEFETHNETHNETDKNTYIIKQDYGVSFDGLDFAEHDKRFKNEIEQLKSELSDAQKSADEYYNKCIDLTKQVAELESELEAKVDFETERLVKLPFDPLETANVLINATYRRKANGIDRFRGCEEDTIETDMYSVDDLEQIAEHLLVYCKHNREDDE